VTTEERSDRVRQKKEKLKKASTASMGKFDKRVNRDEVQKKFKKKTQKIANIFDPEKEVARNKGKPGSPQSCLR
jgi:ABC-type enterochelin transport system substrate-binding protein